MGDRVVWTRGFGVANAETGATVTPDTLFQIGSVTKSFTAAAILAAASEGVLKLDVPVSTYVKGLVACVGAPTLAQLLSHTGGLIDEPDEFGPQGEEGLGAYQRTWTGEYCMLPPGRAFSYSNSGFSLAGLALQEADKTPFADASGPSPACPRRSAPTGAAPRRADSSTGRRRRAIAGVVSRPRRRPAYSVLTARRPGYPVAHVRAPASCPPDSAVWPDRRRQPRTSAGRIDRC